MYTDGETFYYRPDPAVRRPRPPRQPAAPQAAAQDRKGEPISDRLQALSSLIESLSGQIERLTHEVAGLAERLQQSEGEPPRGGRSLQHQEGPDPWTASAPALPGAEEVRVSLYAGEGTTAVVGQARLLMAQEPDP